MLGRLPRQRDGSSNELLAEPTAMKLLRSLGSDQIIITDGLNFKRHGQLNTDAALANEFMQHVFGKLSMQPGSEASGLIITTSTFHPAADGKAFISSYM